MGEVDNLKSKKKKTILEIVNELKKEGIDVQLCQRKK
ncbi:hypothetical protein Bcell_2037 [Evansella cellulosilytica DSM 2522]|uniref:Uncharacterized protein n=1 Tax=Evansella cellulosilytica (strain ATCC 21833 / DSM 2522 / FERM P-1141 / JCM 9156 / N-4) TaxID=649639 RepID=E6U0Y7_EVAC2|nr:hypothetical protein Bcell_2037 [Evansella cellulosilytica DSM 2522]